mgnify:CR=1 FL=1
MAKKKPLSKTQIEYRKQRRRIQQAIRRAEKRGYIVEKEAILPDIPKKVTQASINRLKKIDTQKIYKNSVKLDTETGEITSGTKARTEERKESAKKAARTRKEKRFSPQTGASEIYDFDYSTQYNSFPNGADIIIQNFRADTIARFPENAGPKLTQWLDNLISTKGKNDVATMLEEASYNGIIINEKVAYTDDLLFSAMADMLDFLPDASPELRQQLEYEWEYDEDWESPE